MPETNPATDLTFRPLRPEDKPRVLEITAHTWGDGDYIPEVWERWLADPKGEFTAAVQDGVVVAIAKLTWQGEGRWWMEGLRVDPERRLKGIGQAMCVYQVALAKKLGGRVARYMTGIRNEGSRRIAERAGFHVLARFVERVAEKMDVPVAAETLTSADLDSVWNMLRESDLAAATKGIYVCDWKACEITRERVAEHLGKGEAMGVRDGAGRVRAWCLTHVESDWDRLGMSCLDGETDGITALALAMRAHAGAVGKVMVEAMTPPHPRVMGALEAAGYHVEVDPQHPDEVREHGVDMLELRLDNA
jgi:GNAT superfamily N-acetyltransferase